MERVLDTVELDSRRRMERKIEAMRGKLPDLSGVGTLSFSPIISLDFFGLFVYHMIRACILCTS
jgi:hypothetical protein